MKLFLFRILLGLLDIQKAREAFQYKIDSVHIPEGRLDMYRREIVVGPDDIALVRTSTQITFVSQKVMPVRKFQL